MASRQTAIWNVPYRRNRYFTGHEETLRRLHNALSRINAVGLTQAQGLSGLGGIGKTQIAVEFAYRHRLEYDAVLWGRADSANALTSSFSEIARLLGLPEGQEQDQSRMVAAVLRWLRLKSRWLLIFDNLDDLALAEPFFPRAGSGHTIFTTRASAVADFAEGLEIAQMAPETGAFLLLRRAELLPLQVLFSRASRQDRELASQISQALDGLPLALDQAGAYIKETPSTLAAYLQLYQERRADLLSRRGSESQEYPESVATTWPPSQTRVTRANPAATDLLTLAAFLAPDAIPESIFSKGAPYLGVPLGPVAAQPHQFNLACREALRFSLIDRAGNDETLTMHRLVQEIVRANTPTRQEEGWRLIPWAFNRGKSVVTQKKWKERAALAVHAAQPDVTDVEQWDACKVWVPHALVCADWIEQEHFHRQGNIDMLKGAGYYLDDQGHYSESETLYQQALLICYQHLGASHLETATLLNNLGGLHYKQGRYQKAEEAYRQAVAIFERRLGANHLSTANSLNGLGMLYQTWGRYAEAMPIMARALDIRSQHLPSTDPQIGASFNNVAAIYIHEGKYNEAELLLQRALTIFENRLGPTHPEVSNALDNLAHVFHKQGKYPQAQALLLRSLAIAEQRMGKTHPALASILYSLAASYVTQAEYTQAEAVAKRALHICEQQLGKSHPDTARSLNHLAVIYVDQKKYREAEELHKRALAIREQLLEASHPDIAETLLNLSYLYQIQGNYADAEPIIQRAQAIYHQQSVEFHPDRATGLNNQATLAHLQGNLEAAEALYQQAQAMFEHQFGMLHPQTATVLRNRAVLLAKQRNYPEAERLMKRTLAIREQTLGTNHAETIAVRAELETLAQNWTIFREEQYVDPAQTLQEQEVQPAPMPKSESGELRKRANQAQSQGNYREAEALYRQSLALLQQQFGNMHPDVVGVLRSLAAVYQILRRYKEAEPILKRARMISESLYGSGHHLTRSVHKEYIELLQLIEQESPKPS